MESRECSFQVPLSGQEVGVCMEQRRVFRVSRGVFLLDVGGPSNMDEELWFEKVTEREEGRR